MSDDLLNEVQEDFKAVEKERFSPYGIVEKMNQSADYENAVRQYYTEQMKSANLPFPVEQYVDNKVVQLRKEVEDLPEYEREKQKSLSDSYNSEKIQEQKNAADALEKDYEDFSKAANVFLEKSNQNERLYLDHTEYLVEYLSEHPSEFRKMSERYFAEGELRNPIPHQEFTPSNAALKKAGAFRKKVLDTATKIAQTNNQVKQTNKLSKSLKQFHQREFQTEYVEVKKSLAQKQAERQKTSHNNQIRL